MGEKELKEERRGQQKGVLAFQLDMKEKRLNEDKAVEDAEVKDLKELWSLQ